MKKPFNQTSYLSQVRRLRKLAIKAMIQYAIDVKSIHFINHGENTTFRVDEGNSKTYLLRIHRKDYHSKYAITEELAWLRHLAKKGVAVPNPVLSKNKKLVETVDSTGTGSRNCSVLEWIHGRFVEKSVKPYHMFQIGQFIADFQNNTPKGNTKDRQYWTASGLVGKNPKFGSIDNLANISIKGQKTLIEARQKILKKLKRFENNFPERQGLIHADLHFGNIISMGKKLGAIDFDDCGYGFFVYDLVIPYISVQNMLGDKKKHLFPEYKKALIEGYRSKREWDSNDERIFPSLVTARKLLMLGWLNSRSDNPRIKKHLKGAAKNALKHLKNE